jgi:hypothetical protein
MNFWAAHPCISPTTVTGALTCTTLDSLMRTSFVFAQISRKRASCKSCLRRSCSIHASRSKGAMFLQSRARQLLEGMTKATSFVYVWEFHKFVCCSLAYKVFTINSITHWPSISPWRSWEVETVAQRSVTNGFMGKVKFTSGPARAEISLSSCLKPHLDSNHSQTHFYVLTLQQVTLIGGQDYHKRHIRITVSKTWQLRSQNSESDGLWDS